MLLWHPKSLDPWRHSIPSGPGFYVSFWSFEALNTSISSWTLCATEKSKVLPWTCANLGFPFNFYQVGLVDGVLFSGKTWEDIYLKHFETKWITLVLLKFGLNSLIGSKLAIGYDGHVMTCQQTQKQMVQVQACPNRFLAEGAFDWSQSPALPPAHSFFFSKCISVKSSCRTLMPYRSAFYIEFQACQMNEKLRHRGKLCPLVCQWSSFLSFSQ